MTMKIGATTTLALLVWTAVSSSSIAQQTAAAIAEKQNRLVAEHLDVLSIPSAIYARRRPGANTLKDYGFVRVEPFDGGIRLTDQNRQRFFGVRILEDNGGFKLLCIQDEALTGSKVIMQNAVEVKLGRDGLFHGTGRVEQTEACPLYQR